MDMVVRGSRGVRQEVRAVKRGQGVSGGLPWALTASSATRRGCETQGVMKQHASGAFWASWVGGMHWGSVLLGLAVCFVVSELCAVVQKGAEVGIQPLLTDVSLMMWRAM